MSSLALLFGAAGARKLGSRVEFERTLQGYELLPEGTARVWLRAAGLLVPVLELLVAAGLLVPAARALASLAGAALLATYAMAIGANLRRGRLQIDCGCSGFGRRRGISGALVWRNLALSVLLLAAGFAPWTARRLDWIDFWTVGCGVCAAALLYLSFDGLLSVSSGATDGAAHD